MKVQRQDILDAALALLDEVGLDGLTMRRLAQALAIQAPSLYWHFPNKQALLDAMADAILAGITLPADPAAGWEDRLRTGAGELRRALKARRDGARVFAGTFPVLDHVLRLSDAIVGTLRQAGAEETEAVRASFTLLYFVLGFTIEEQAAEEQAAEEQASSPPDGGTAGLPRLPQRLTAAQVARYPHAASAVAIMSTDDAEARFRFGLDLLVGGLARRLAPGS